MDAFEKWWISDEAAQCMCDCCDDHDTHLISFNAGKAEGIKEGMRRAAEIMRGRKVLASDFYHELLLKEIGE
jgi:hypothetical protein